MILWELAKTTFMALLGVSILMTLVGAMVEAARQGLDPLRVVMAIPYLIPPTLPYTIPTCVLLACTMVFGSMSSENEVTAVKAAGISPWALLSPAFLLGAAMMLFGIYLTDRFIPASNTKFTEIILSDLEGSMMLFLKQKGSITEPSLPYEIYVKNVHEGKLIQPIIKRRRADGAYDLVVHAAEAKLNVVRLGDDDVVKVRLYDGVAARAGAKENSGAHFRQFDLDMPLPATIKPPEQKIGNLSYDACLARSRDRLKLAHQTEVELAWDGTAALMGNNLAEYTRDFPWKVEETNRLYRKSRESSGEVHMRLAQSVAALAFVLIGCPLAILLQRKDFLQTFFLCFLPIVTLYYPAMILCFNFFKEDLRMPFAILWLPTALLSLVGCYLIAALAKN